MLPPPPIIKKGTYVFYDGEFFANQLWTRNTSVTQPMVAKSNNTHVSSIILLTGSEKTSEGIYITEISYDLNVSGMTKTTQVYSQDLETSAWTSNAYKTIEITEDCIVDEKFKKWFDYYTTKQ